MNVCSKTVKYAALPGLSPAQLLLLEGALNKQAGCAPPVPTTKKPNNIGPGPSQLLVIQAALNKQAGVVVNALPISTTTTTLVETPTIANTIAVSTAKTTTKIPSGAQNVLPQGK